MSVPNTPRPESTARRPKEDTRPPLGWWASGDYINQCRTCGDYFIGYKLAGECADCAYGGSDTVDPHPCNKDRLTFRQIGEGYRIVDHREKREPGLMDFWGGSDWVRVPNPIPGWDSLSRTTTYRTRTIYPFLGPIVGRFYWCLDGDQSIRIEIVGPNIGKWSGGFVEINNPSCLLGPL